MDGSAQELIFVVDDNETLRTLMERWIRQEGYDVVALESGEVCLEALHEELPAAICLDLHMPGLGGMETLKRAHALHPPLPIIVLTGDEQVETAAAAIEAGACVCLSKPIDHTRLLTTLRNAVERARHKMLVFQLEGDIERRGHPGIVGNSPAMMKLFGQLDRAAVSDGAVLIHGESGTGKEFAARAIHRAGSQSAGPFVVVTPAAIPEPLLESELFGRENGSSTLGSRIGRLEEADRGTLFLDEISELPAAIQAKLLRVVKERTFRRVGGADLLRSDFRLISATDRNLHEEVKAGRLREDLYFQLAVFRLELPPLRQRREDIPALAQGFIRQKAAASGTVVRGVAKPTLQALMDYPWPGNVRELQNVVQRALMVADGEDLQLDDLPDRLRSSAAIARLNGWRESGGDPGMLEEVSRRLLVSALTRHNGNGPAVMGELKIEGARFIRMLRKYGLEGKVDRAPVGLQVTEQ